MNTHSNCVLGSPNSTISMDMKSDKIDEKANFNNTLMHNQRLPIATKNSFNGGGHQRVLSHNAFKGIYPHQKIMN